MVTTAALWATRQLGSDKQEFTSAAVMMTEEWLDPDPDPEPDPDPPQPPPAPVPVLALDGDDTHAASD